MGCPRRGLLLCSLPSILAPGDPTGEKNPASRRQRHSQGERVPAHLSNPPSPFLDTAVHQCFHFRPFWGDSQDWGDGTGDQQSREEKGDTWWDPCSPLPTCTTLQLSVSEDQRGSWGQHHSPFVPPGGDKEGRQEQVTLMRSGKNLQSTWKAAVASTSGSPSLFSQ